MNKSYVFKFRAENKDIFEAIRNGEKKTETRAGSIKYKDIKAGEEIIFACGKNTFSKKIKSVKHFKTLRGLFKVYKPIEINPRTRTFKEAEAMYYSFPQYKEKIKKYGIIAFELE